MRLMRGLFYSAGVVSLVITAYYYKRISEQLDSIIKQDEDTYTNIYMDGNKEEDDIHTDIYVDGNGNKVDDGIRYEGSWIYLKKKDV